MVDITFHVFDSNRDGNLSANEFIRVLHKRERDIARPVESGLLGFLSCCLNCADNCSLGRLVPWFLYLWSPVVSGLNFAELPGTSLEVILQLKNVIGDANKLALLLFLMTYANQKGVCWRHTDKAVLSVNTTFWLCSRAMSHYLRKVLYSEYAYVVLYFDMLLKHTG